MDILDIANLIVGVGISLLGLFLLYLLPNSWKTKKRLDNEAKETTGRIVNGEWHRRGKSRVYFTYYEYTVGRKKLTGSAKGRLTNYYSSGAIPIEYLEDNPEVHRIKNADPSNYSLPFILMFLIGAGLVGLGLYMVYAGISG